MSHDDATSERVFFEVFESLPRQGPGHPEALERALAHCRGLSPVPRIADLGCGCGAQTLQLAERTTGSILAVDRHPPSIARLRRAVVERGLEKRVWPCVADITALPAAPGSFDLVWSEGALYGVGLATALPLCRRLLRPGGFLAFTDCVFTRADPPEAVRAAFASESPGMGTVAETLESIGRSGLTHLAHFRLPEEAWWGGFYEPMAQRIEELRSAFPEDAAVRAVRDEITAEVKMRREHAEAHDELFFVARLDPRGSPSRR